MDRATPSARVGHAEKGRATMTSRVSVPVLAAGVLLVALGESPGRDGAAPFDGVWRTSLGTVTLKQEGETVTGTYGDAGQFTLKGTVRGKKLTFEYQQGKTKGDGHWTLADSGHAFVGEYQARG